LIARYDDGLLTGLKKKLQDKETFFVSLRHEKREKNNIIQALFFRLHGDDRGKRR
jgi:hypothetical protein